MQNLTATIEGTELVLRAKLDSPIGLTNRGTVILAQSGYQEHVGPVGFRVNVWASPEKTTTKGLSPVTDEARKLTQALLAKVSNTSRK